MDSLKGCSTDGTEGAVRGFRPTKQSVPEEAQERIQKVERPIF